MRVLLIDLLAYDTRDGDDVMKSPAGNTNLEIKFSVCPGPTHDMIPACFYEYLLLILYLYLFCVREQRKAGERGSRGVS